MKRSIILAAVALFTVGFAAPSFAGAKSDTAKLYYTTKGGEQVLRSISGTKS